MLRIVRDRAAFPEWYDAGELAALCLPGLPASRSAIAQKAGREGWKRRAAKGRRVLFHVSSLPARAFARMTVLAQSCRWWSAPTSQSGCGWRWMWSRPAQGICLSVREAVRFQRDAIRASHRRLARLGGEA